MTDYISTSAHRLVPISIYSLVIHALFYFILISILKTNKMLLLACLHSNKHLFLRNYYKQLSCKRPKIKKKIKPSDVLLKYTQSK